MATRTQPPASKTITAADMNRVINILGPGARGRALTVELKVNLDVHWMSYLLMIATMETGRRGRLYSIQEAFEDWLERVFHSEEWANYLEFLEDQTEA